MKLIRVDQDQFRFEITLEEQVFLFHLLHQYPLVPAEYQSLSEQGQIKDLEENQRMLEEALQAQRLANRKQIIELLNAPGRFELSSDGAGYFVSFSRGEIEWLLQICNDIRLGSWLALGSPDLDEKSQLGQNPESARFLVNMEIAGAFEMQLIHTINGKLDSDDEETGHIG